jgi:hypothetical protein
LRIIHILAYPVAATLMLGAAAAPAAAQGIAGQTDVNAPPSSAIVPGLDEEGFGAFGTTPQDTWIAGFQFQGKLNSGQADLLYAGHYYATNPGSATNQRYFAQLPLPSGAQISRVECLVNDGGANDVLVALQRSTFDVSTNAPTSTSNVASASSTGTSGYQTVGFNVSEPVAHTSGNLRNLYFLAADIASNTSLRACRVVWSRTISPAPATATFGDVPTSHAQFRFVEALVAAGITGGCGGGLYCPDSALTRGQMAVFLSVALGLHFPQ